MAKRSAAKLSTAELQAELRRRERELDSLMNKRDKLLAQLEEIEATIEDYGDLETGSGGATTTRRKRSKKKRSGRRRAGAGKRHRNKEKLTDALVKVLKGKTMSVTEVADAVQKAGYKTTSPNFRTIVNQALLKDKRVKRVGHGKYTAK